MIFHHKPKVASRVKMPEMASLDPMDKQL